MTLKYILPNFYDNYLYNKTIMDKLITKRNICGIQGTFPLSIYNGSYNNIYGEEICLYDKIATVFSDYGLLSDMAILDYGNPFLEDTDYYDLYNRVILEEFAEKETHYFAVSQVKFIDFLISKYPKINIILHQNYTREHTSEEIQILIDKYPNIKGIIISSFNLCTKVKNVFKIYLLPIHGCEECVHYHKCLKHDNYATLEFSGKSEFAECKWRKLIYPETIIERIHYVKDYCDYILFDTVIRANDIEEYALIETVIEKAEEHS